MSSAYNNDLHEPVEQDREISLGAATVIGIFFALALLCALFFGLGYSMGRRSTQAAEAPTPSDNPPVSSTTTTPKPRSGSADAPPPVSAQPITTQPVSSPSPAAAPVTADQLPQPTTEKPPATTSFMVQVAAVSHREDADTLIQALDQRGYDVAIRQEPQDKLFHVQIGPFTIRRDAEAMRQHLLADGYNAIVK